MIMEMWGNFPRLMVQNINGLLDVAMPNALRSLHIYRALRNNGLSNASVQEFSRNLEEFYSRPLAERRKSHFDRFLAQPMDLEVYSLFHLDFRSGVVPEKAILDLASWAHNLIRVSKKTTSAFMSLDVMIKTIRRITTPSRFEKAQDIGFSDFCAAWKRTVVSQQGHANDPEFDELLEELKWMNGEIKKPEIGVLETALAPGVYLTQTEIDWTIAVRNAAFAGGEVPKFPLSRGPEKPALKDLERAAALYSASKTSRLPEIAENREKIRATVLDRCDKLLGHERKLAS